MLVSIQDRKQSFNFPLHDVSVILMVSDDYQAKLRAPRRILAWCYGLTRLCTSLLSVGLQLTGGLRSVRAAADI